MFVFCNRKRDRLKILEWDGDVTRQRGSENLVHWTRLAHWLFFKRLERGHFRWPQTDGEAKSMSLTAEELSCLINGARLEKKLKRTEVFERSAA